MLISQNLVPQLRIQMSCIGGENTKKRIDYMTGDYLRIQKIVTGIIIGGQTMSVREVLFFLHLLQILREKGLATSI